MAKVIPLWKACAHEYRSLDVHTRALHSSQPQRGHTMGYDPEKDDRTDEQLEIFDQGLEGINRWYQHQYTLVCLGG